MTRYCLLLASTLTLAACSANTGLEQSVTDMGGKCDAVMTYDIDFDRFDETAQQIAHGTGCHITADLADLGAVEPQPVKGVMTPRAALAEAIKGTRIAVVEQKPDEIVVK
ncbi:hypothetical protein D6851_01540 [Altericroceibacterium spongiae]|uniref:Lipoprotein n=1 Tax=Altericroceibacterium spongiae TaxID=2320269 RepID=A0A420ER80_9SPHN|nr:hypothetical protein [Altericroceibacterium spongiae]RKF23192.1 hypothetical protein D6851_01540 [Altericroceibacterium spongiae]